MHSTPAMTRACPTKECKNPAESSFQVRKTGRYFRKSDRKWIQRFHCENCGRHFSAASFSPCFGQNKRHLNPVIEKLLSSCNSMRRIAKLLGINKNTVARKLQFLGIQADRINKKGLDRIHSSELREIQFDDLITIEHTKLKQVSIPIILTKSSRKILAIDACRIPTSGLLAKIALKKYGFRPNEHPATLEKLLRQLRGIVPEDARFTTDSHQAYPICLKTVFPNANHHQEASRRASVVGQGELKTRHFDPLFSLNHTCAMLRANINRLVRRSWCTTKKLEALRWHLAIYVKYHNSQLTT
jgi:transposase-like protein